MRRRNIILLNFFLLSGNDRLLTIFSLCLCVPLAQNGALDMPPPALRHQNMAAAALGGGSHEDGGGEGSEDDDPRWKRIVAKQKYVALRITRGLHPAAPQSLHGRSGETLVSSQPSSQPSPQHQAATTSGVEKHSLMNPPFARASDFPEVHPEVSVAQDYRRLPIDGSHRIYCAPTGRALASPDGANIADRAEMTSSSSIQQKPRATLKLAKVKIEDSSMERQQQADHADMQLRSSASVDHLSS